MATSLSAVFHAYLETDLIPTSPSTGSVKGLVENATTGRRWANGTGSGQVDRIYIRERSGLGAAATDSYNLLAAGALTDPLGQAIDADELKGLVLKVTSGAVKLVSTAANGLDFFTDASKGVKLAATAGCNCIALDFGAAGLSVATNSKFDIVETSGATTADYTLILIVAQ